MPTWLWISPFITACAGWLLHRMAIGYIFSLRGPLIQKRAQWTAQLAKQAAALVSFREMEEKITGSSNMQQIMPVIETHIDDFLHHRLKEAMPMISMFIGEKTIQQLKTIFMKELEQIFPQVMKNYMGNLQQELDIEKIVIQKISAIPDAILISTLKASLAKEAGMLLWLGALSGFIAGLIEIFIFLAAR